MSLLSFITLVAGLLLGGLMAYLYEKRNQPLSPEKVRQLQQERQDALQNVSRLEERNQNISDQWEQARHELSQAREAVSQNEKENVRLQSVNENLNEKLRTQKQELSDLHARFKDEFENLANKILEEKSQKFSQQNQEKLNQILNPLGERLESFKKKVEETYEKEMREQTSLKEQIRQMAELNKQMTDEAQNLTKALKGESKTQGSWGEVILQRILEKSGLTKGREYRVEQHHTLDDGSRLRPDVVVHLPDEKRLIIDSKVSLTAYERYTSATEENERQRQLSQHVASIRGHVKKLSHKKYEQLYGGQSPDFILLFMPIESAFGAALQHDSNLYYEAFEKNIVIVSPSTLLATLATIESVWKQEYQSKNAQEIARRGGLLFDKFKLFAESMEEVGQRIRQTRESYDQAMNRLHSGRGNLVGQARKLKELGANTNEQLPSQLLQQHETAQNEAEEPSIES